MSCPDPDGPRQAVFDRGPLIPSSFPLLFTYSENREPGLCLHGPLLAGPAGNLDAKFFHHVHLGPSLTLHIRCSAEPRPEFLTGLTQAHSHGSPSSWHSSVTSQPQLNPSVAPQLLFPFFFSPLPRCFFPHFLHCSYRPCTF